MSAPPRASRRGGGLNADYYNPPNQYHYPDDPRLYGPGSPPRSPRHQYDETPPVRSHRRHKSEHRRPLTPEYEDIYEKPPRRRTRQAEPEVVSYPNHGRKYSVPEVVNPPYAPRSPEPERVRRRDKHRDYDRPPRRQERSSMPPPAREPYDAYVAPGYASDRRRPPKAYRGDPEPRSSRRPRHDSPPPPPAGGRSRGYDRPEPRSGGRRPRDHYDAPDQEYDAPPPRRARSQGRPRRDIEGSPPPRGRRGPSSHERSRGAAKAPPARRQSVPASSKPQVPWWQNPMVQAGARYAITAGAQAAFRSKDDKGPWLGHKGAKVAGAALSAALVDGIIGQKHNNSVRQELLRTGANAAMADIERGKYPVPNPSSSRRR